ncbi:MAG: DUF3313 domain-containing protein [Gammaproteobacteria bacterium]
MTINRLLLLAAGILVLSMQQALADNTVFIEDLPPLGQDADRTGAMIWLKPDLDRAYYTQVMIEPITIFISQDSKYKGLNADDLKALADGFIVALTETLEPEVPVLNKSGPGILYLRAALTNVKLAKKKKSILNYTPVGLVATAAADAAGLRISLQEAVLEIELLDSVSGERLGVIVDKSPKAAGEKMSWDAINATFVDYGERFKARMKEAVTK